MNKKSVLSSELEILDILDLSLLERAKSEQNAGLCEKRRRFEWKKALKKSGGNVGKAMRIYCVN